MTLTVVSKGIVKEVSVCAKKAGQETNATKSFVIQGVQNMDSVEMEHVSVFKDGMESIAL